MKFLKIFILFFLISSKAMAYESAPYEVVEDLGEKIEIRKYQDLILAQVAKNDNEDNSFRVLFKFITGKNDKNQEINMTTPVFQEVAKGNSIMSFVMPAEFKMEDLPKPTSGEIKFRKVENQKFIAIRFSGFRTENNFGENREKLIEKIKEKNIKADLENPIRATYDAPWTLPFLRRNEVLFKMVD
jgi:hypothetical protein